MLRNRTPCSIGLLVLSFLISVGCSESGSSNGSPDASDDSRSEPADSLSQRQNSDPPTTEDREPGGGNDPTSGQDDDDDEPAAVFGTLAGVVTFKGKLPPPRMIQATKDAEFCSDGEGEVQDVVVSDGRLFGAVVELTFKGRDLPDFAPPEEGFVLRQKNCRFSPRLLVAYDGAELTVFNDDKVEHNVNTGSWNLLQSPNGEAIKEKISYQGTPFARVTCNIHSWMESWVYVARSPFYAASDAMGAYRIDGIPVGTRIRGTVMHSVLGRKRFTAEIKAGETTTMNFEYEAK